MRSWIIVIVIIIHLHIIRTYIYGICLTYAAWRGFRDYWVTDNFCPLIHFHSVPWRECPHGRCYLGPSRTSDDRPTTLYCLLSWVALLYFGETELRAGAALDWKGPGVVQTKGLGWSARVQYLSAGILLHPSVLTKPGCLPPEWQFLMSDI